FKYAERSRHIEFVIENLPDIQGDMNMLKQVWVNLISNAVKYSAGTDRTIIRISSYKESEEVVYTIADNGVGFDMLFYDKLFGVFQRLHNTDEFDGTGVGLAIVQRIINKHKGKIWANAVVNAGATFYFSIPNEN
ncbi:ATP-binding protein, partial [Cutibacterium acnes]